ncbi:uncharacterized protein si:ch211-171b20.3 [Scomber scombrus]|uniref:Uncharacterized protein si:ch211-171b20.3 n=1 Tax=Scomber scombrus TaxID=13677 RepID=A0AAV1PPR3_SCOSC
MGAGGGQAALRQNINPRRKFPVIQPLGKSKDGKSLLSGLIVGGKCVCYSTSGDSQQLEGLQKKAQVVIKVFMYDRLEAEKNGLEKDICGRHFLFDQKCGRLERTRTVIPPLPRDFHVHRPGNLHPFSLSKDLSHSHVGRPFTLGCPERYELNTSPAILFPSTLVLNGRNTFSVENCKLSRPKVNYPTYNLLTAKDNQKSQSYPDPMAGSSRSFIQRISELSSLEGETVRQEKLKKLRKSRKPPS